MTKEEIKHWKKVAKEYRKNPAALMELTEEHDRLQQNSGQFQERINNLESELMTEKSRIVELEQENARLNNSLAATQQTLVNIQNQQAQAQQIREQQATSQPSVSVSESGMPMGTVFMVQVGAFRKGGVPQKFYQYDDLYVEEAGSMHKVLIGKYRSYDDAKSRLGTLKREGYSNAWVVPFIDGQRVSLKEALNN